MKAMAEMKGGGGEAGAVKGWLRSKELIRGREFHSQTRATRLYTSAIVTSVITILRTTVN